MQTRKSSSNANKEIVLKRSRVPGCKQGNQMACGCAGALHGAPQHACEHACASMCEFNKCIVRIQVCSAEGNNLESGQTGSHSEQWPQGQRPTAARHKTACRHTSKVALCWWMRRWAPSSPTPFMATTQPLVGSHLAWSHQWHQGQSNETIPRCA